MALLIATPTSDRISHGAVSGTPAADMGAWTCILWTRTTATVGTFQNFVSNGDSSFDYVRYLQTAGASGGLTKIATNVLYTTGGNVFYSSSFVIPASTDIVIAAAFDENGSSGDQVRHYYGTPAAAMALSTNTYADSNTTAANRRDDSAGTIALGDPVNAATTATAQRPSRIMIFNVRLTLAQIEAQRRCPWPIDPANCVLWTEYGRYGTGTQPDWSGSGLNATVTSATQAAHMPRIGDPMRRLIRPSFVDVAAAGGASIFRNSVGTRRGSRLVGA